MTNPTTSPDEVAPGSTADDPTFSESIARGLFGYDVFISYPRKDGEAIALVLYRSLRHRGYLTFLDRYAGLYGTALERTLRAALGRSQAMVVIATPASFLSRHVAFEVATYLDLHRAKPRPIIVIGTRDARLTCPWESLRGIVWIEAEPSGELALHSIVGNIEQRLVTTRREVLLRNGLAIAASVFLVVAVFALWQWREAVRQRDRALALRLASRSELLREEQADALETAALLAVESALRGPGEAFETGRALARALDLIPRPSQDFPLPGLARALRFTDNGDGLVTVLANGTLRVSDRSGRLQWEETGAADTVAILSASLDVVRTVDAQGVISEWRKGDPPTKSGMPLPAGGLLSADGRHALIPALGPNTPGQLIDLATGAVLIAGIQRDVHDITVLLVSPDPVQRFVLAATQRERTVILIDRQKGTRTDLERGNVVDVAAFSADGTRVALGGRNFEVAVFNTSGDDLVATARVRHQHFVRAVAFSADGLHLLTSSFDHTSRLIATDSGLEEMRVPYANDIDAIAFDPRGDLVAMAGGSRIRIVPARSGARLRQLPVEMRAISALSTTASPAPGGARVPILLTLAAIGGDRVAFANTQSQEISTFDVTSGERLGRWPIAVKPLALGINRAGTTVVAIGEDRGVWMTAGKGMERLGEAPVLGGMMPVAVGREWIVVGGEMGLRALSRTTPGATCDVMDTANIRAVALADRSAKAIVGSDRVVEVIDLTSCHTILRVHQPDAVLSVAVSPDDGLMAVGTADTPVVRVYRVDSSSAAEQYAIPRQGTVRTMAFSPKGDRLAVGAEDRTTRVYDMRDGQEISRTLFTISPWSVGFSADGYSVRSLTGEDSSGGTQAAIAERSLDISTMIADVCQRIGDRALSDSEWGRYLPGVAYRRTCGTIHR